MCCCLTAPWPAADGDIPHDPLCPQAPCPPGTGAQNNPANAMLSRYDYWQLNEHRRRSEELGGTLLARLIRAKMLAAAVVDSDQLSADVVTGSARITFALDRQPAETRVLYHWSYPDDAHRRLRVGSPLGVTLIGMSAGQSSGWLDGSGTPRSVHVLSVAPNAP